MASGDLVTAVGGIQKGSEVNPTHTLEARHELDEGRDYTWKVVATDKGGNTVDSNQTWNLLVPDTFAPPVPLIKYPVLSTANPRPTFIWDTAYDPNGVQYKIELATDEAMTNVVADSGGLERRTTPRRERVLHCRNEYLRPSFGARPK